MSREILAALRVELDAQLPLAVATLHQAGETLLVRPKQDWSVHEVGPDYGLVCVSLSSDGVDLKAEYWPPLQAAHRWDFPIWVRPLATPGAIEALIVLLQWHFEQLNMVGGRSNSS